MALAALENFPFEVVETDGERALETWEELKTAGRGAPVVLGGDLENLVAPFGPRSRWSKSVEDILAEAAAIAFPDDLFKFREAERAEAAAWVKKAYPQWDKPDDESEAPLGDWPTEIDETPGLSVTYDYAAQAVRPRVHIALIPTDDPTTIPAFMRWGRFNECPSSAFHVAALRSWRDRHGAELIGLDADTLNLRIPRKPATREEALDLARAHYAYCNDVVDQGVGTLRALAAGLMAHDWWFFWWD